ncbi:transglutaminase-like domain-containing protein [Streptomyces sp. NPDC003691]
MELIQQTDGIAAYLAADDTIDHGHPLVRETAARLRRDTSGAHDYARAAFEFVRDSVTHSIDADDPRVTRRASEVLEQGTGICYAKAHALVALLRAESIPAALCYQNLGVVHGLVALRLPGRDRWSRIDPRGNRPGVDAQFSLDEERLAFTVDPESNEVDYPVLYAAPHPAVLAALRAAPDRKTLCETLPTAL